MSLLNVRIIPVEVTTSFRFRSDRLCNNLMLPLDVIVCADNDMLTESAR
ncbi:hypothetical protein QFZ77_006344 [Paenibacillus sp. V4I3]|nr:hypothetical protein [Paenibacillus sp. V4I3]